MDEGEAAAVLSRHTEFNQGLLLNSEHAFLIAAKKATSRFESVQDTSSNEFYELCEALSVLRKHYKPMTIEDYDRLVERYKSDLREQLSSLTVEQLEEELKTVEGRCTDFQYAKHFHRSNKREVILELLCERRKLQKGETG